MKKKQPQNTNNQKTDWVNWIKNFQMKGYARNSEIRVSWLKINYCTSNVQTCIRTSFYNENSISPPPQIMNLKFMMVQQGGFKILHRNIMENILESFPEAQGCNSLN